MSLWYYSETDIFIAVVLDLGICVGFPSDLKLQFCL